MPEEQRKKPKKVTIKSVRTEREFSNSPGPSSLKSNISGIRRAQGQGKPIHESWNVDMSYVRSLFLRSISGIYLVAFLSLYLQIEGLYGSNGVTPAKAELKLNTRKPEKCFQEKRTLLCLLVPTLNLTTQQGMELLTIIGVALSGLGFLCVHMCVVPVMAALWVIYFSLYQVGGVFLWFQWDILLLETGVLAVLSAPWFPTKGSQAPKPRDQMSMWMVKWLLFRLMFASGVVKLLSDCPTWWGLTALNYHFESQCLPTSLAYYAHHFPEWLLRLGVVGTYFIEIVLPFAFFSPLRFLRLLSFWAQVLFQLAIILTGNYNYFNLLTIVLCFSLLDTEAFEGSKRAKVETFSFTRVITRSCSFILFGLGLYYTFIYFGVTLKPNYTLDSKVEFTRSEFDRFISLAVPWGMGIGLLTLGSVFSSSLLVSVVSARGAWRKLTSLFAVLIYGIIFATIFAISCVPFSTLHRETNQGIWAPVKELYSNVSNYHVVGSYGLFRRMTGTEGGRPEVVLEYSEDLNGPWKEYQFLYKPGNVEDAPKFIVPHQPRLDWQMWFAAIGTYHDNPWLVSLAYRLLQGEPAVQKLLNVGKNPSKPPKYIRASSYLYTYTKPTSGSSNWWTRKRVQEFMPVFSVDHKPLVEFIRNLGYLDPEPTSKDKANPTLVSILDGIRNISQSYPPEFVIWGSVTSLIVLILTSKLFSK